MRTPRRLVACAIAAAIHVVSPCSVAHAQLGANAGFVEAFQPDFLSRDMVVFADVLELDDSQQAVLESLLNDYADSFKLGTEGLKDRMKAMKDQILAAGDQGAMGVILGPINAWTAEKRKLHDRFVENVQAILSDEQVARWPKLEWAMRREKELPRGVLSGESLDLVAIARASEVPPEVMKASATDITAYEVAIDGALADRARQMAESQERIKAALVSNDNSAGLREIELIVAKRVVLRDLQEKYIPILATAFGPQYGPAFRDRALREAFPTVYRPSSMIPYFAAARELPGLSPDQTTQLNALEAEYSKWYAQWQTNLAQLYRTEEPKKQSEEARRRATQGQANVPKPTDPYRPMHEERDRYDEQTREAICKIVGPELCEQLPGAAKVAAAQQRPMTGAGKGNESEPNLAPSGGIAEPRGRSRSQESRALPSSGTRSSNKDAPKSAE